MKSQFLNLNEAASLINKSTQTLRRLIKSNKVKYRRKKTPQGFVYYIDILSLRELFNKYFSAHSLHQLSNIENSINSIEINTVCVQEIIPTNNIYSTTNNEQSLQHAQFQQPHSQRSTNLILHPITDNRSDRSLDEDFFVINKRGQDILKDQHEINESENQRNFYYEDKKHNLINQIIDYIRFKIENSPINIADSAYKADTNIMLINQLEGKIKILSNTLEKMIHTLQESEKAIIQRSIKWWHFWK